MYCPSCGFEERQLSQFCRGCGIDLRSVRNSLENPDVLTQSAISAREHIGMAVADKIRQINSAKELEKVAEDVLPHFEKFLETPEEKRLRRVRSGIITAAIGLAATVVMFLLAMDKMQFFPFVTPALITLLVGVGVTLNGLVFTVPRKQMGGEQYDPLSQKVFDGGSRISHEAPSVPTLTNELLPASRPPVTSVTEHTTQHLKSTDS